jgi:uncharacterized protein YuzE
MKVRIDKEADAMYIDLDETKKAVESEEVKPGIIFDFNADGLVVGIEILFMSKRNPEVLRHVLIETV